MAKKIVIVVAEDSVDSVFVENGEEVEVEVVNFDSNFTDLEIQTRLGDYVDKLRETMKEIRC